jgi:hypothetical protein
MSTTAQILANRQNAAHSTGPKSPDGKLASSRNATRHGLAGIFTVLPHENPEDFNDLAARLRDEFQPDGENENFLVDQMIQSRCRLLRIQRLEALALEQILTEPGSNSDPDARILTAMCASGNALDKLQRYAAAAERPSANSRTRAGCETNPIELATGHWPLDTGHCLSQNEPNLRKPGPHTAVA